MHFLKKIKAYVIFRMAWRSLFENMLTDPKENFMCIYFS